MLNFAGDYMETAHPAILKVLAEKQTRDMALTAIV